MNAYCVVEQMLAPSCPFGLLAGFGFEGCGGAEGSSTTMR